MKKAFLFLTVIPIVSIGISCISIAGNKGKISPSGNITKKTIETASFNKINVSQAIVLQFHQGEQSIVMEAYENIHDYVDISVKDNILNVKFKDGIYVKGEHKTKAYVSSGNINGFTVSGASKVMLGNKLTTDNLLLDISGASSFKGDVDCKKMNLSLSGASNMNTNMNCQDLKADISGAGSVNFSGILNSGEITVSGAAKMQAQNLDADVLSINIRGAASADVHVKKELSYDVSGASKLRYSGNPAIRRVSVTGASSVSSY